MKNISIVARNAVWLTLQPIVTGVLSLVVTALVARYLGTEGYGQLLLLLSYVALVAPVISLGLRPYSVREIAAQPERVLEIMEEMLALRLALALAAMPASAAFFEVVPDQVPPRLLAFFLMQVFFNALSTCFIDGLYGLERMKPAATVMLFSGFVVQIASVVAVLADAGVEGVTVAYTLGSLATLALAWRYFVREAGRVALRRVRFGDLHHIRGSWAFFFQNVVSTVRARIDVIVINAMLGAHAAGIYGAARSLLYRLEFLWDGLGTALFPRLAQLYGRDDAELHRLVRAAVKAGLVMSTPVTIGLLFTADDIIGLVYGAEYGEGGRALWILGVGLPLMFSFAVLFNTLRAIKLERELLVLTVAGGLTSVVLLVLGIRWLGVDGAAFAAVAVYGALLVASVALYARRYGAPLGMGDFAKLVVANAFLALVLYALRDMNFGIRVLAGVACFPVAVLVLRLANWQTIRAALSRGGGAAPETVE